MNIKSAASILGKSKNYISGQVRVLGFEKINGQYEIEESDLDLISKKLGKKQKKSVSRELSKAHKIKIETLGTLANRLGLSFKRDREKIAYACTLRRTGHFTLKGLKWMLQKYESPRCR